MTDKLPEPNVLDKLLHILGIRRAVIVPSEAYEKYGQYVYVKGKKESFWKALLRPKGTELSEGSLDLFDYPEEYADKAKTSNVKDY